MSTTAASMTFSRASKSSPSWGSATGPTTSAPSSLRTCTRSCARKYSSSTTRTRLPERTRSLCASRDIEPPIIICQLVVWRQALRNLTAKRDLGYQGLDYQGLDYQGMDYQDPD